VPVAYNQQSGEAVFLTPNGSWEKAQTAINPTTKEMVAYDGKEWKPLPQRSKGVLDYADDAIRSVASGVTFGFADEIAAKMDELIGRGTYQENVERERARDKQISPWLSVPGEVAGGVAGAVAALPLAGAAGAVTGASRLPQTARFILSGAAGGALFGAGGAEEGNRLSGAATGAAIGAGAGYVAPKVVSGISSVAGGIRNALMPEAGAAADISRAALRDGMTPQQLATNLTAARQSVPEATLADVGGENVRGLVERVAQTPGAGRTTVVPALEARQQSQMNRVAFDLSRLTGTNRTASQAISETMSERSASAQPLYQEALDFNARAVPEIAQAWQNATAQGWGQSILNSANLRRTLQTEYGIRDVRDAPMMVLVDAWKKEVDGVVGEAIRAGNNRKAQVLGNMRDSVVGVVDQHNPAYLSARNAWAGPSQYLDAIEQGRNVLSGRVTAEELPALLARMSDVEREAYRIGAVGSIVSKMGNDPARMADMTKYLRSPEVRAKIAALMPDDASREAWANRLNFEVGSSALTGRALGNSATARRLAERDDANGIVVDLVADALQGSPASLARRLLNGTVGRARDTLRSRTDNVLADTLVGQNGNVFQRLMSQPPSRAPLRVTVNPAAINATNALAQ
jgi:hypothetical protein